MFATLPLPDVDGALRELEYAFDTLKADGVVLESNFHGVYLGDARFDPVFEELNRRHAKVFIHPTNPHCPCCQVQPKGENAEALPPIGYPYPMIEFMFETTRAVFNLLLSGTLDRFPNVQIIVPHAGATIPVLADRVAGLSPALGLPEKLDAEKFMTSLRGMYYDLAGFPLPRQLNALLEIADPKHVLYGSDYPYTPEPLGGLGLKLPGNILCWGIISLVIFVAGILLFSLPVHALPQSLKLFILGGILLSLPALYTSQVVSSTAYIRLAGLWGGIALFWVLTLMPFSSQQRKLLLLSVLVGALMEWSITLWQFTTHSYDNWMEFVPGTRPYGIFQQINVLASFLATGYAIALWFCLNTANRLLTNFCRLAVFLLPAMLVILQSRIGYLGSTAVLALMCVIYRLQPRKILLLIALSLCGVAIGELLKNSHWLELLVAIVDKEGSNSERIYIIKSTIEMIRQRPIFSRRQNLNLLVKHRQSVTHLVIAHFLLMVKGVHHPGQQNVFIQRHMQ
ncbi:amidohydrolase 2 [Buttiauxella agrestis ATCC 33320]|uniref:6-methylsalicylate decarboxylase n=1 Tax=Buttiauxella agrestis ATCC 33320 TaxID=1006004 RepID=A0A085GE19_9ENTR|nr:pilin glycosylation ligase domain-containing protein [Buttiauxella agrestis]KFC81964.1 amidohydrolase 2 [Buttiauxella agrestis ATCC 33320]